MKRILGKKSALATAVGSSLMGAMLVSALAGCASTTSAGGDSTTSDGSSSTTTATGTSDVSATYKDGSYSADGSYSSPDGQEEIAVTLTVKSNVVTAVNVTSVSANGEGQRYQAIFASAISSEVVGKQLATLNVSNVAGASLTSQGFDTALATIRTNAQS